jgi:RND family efflux transporter MFP subunit
MSDISRAPRADLEKLRISDTERRSSRRRRRWPFVAGGMIVILVALMIVLRPPLVRVVTASVDAGGPAEAGNAVLTANGYIEARHQAAVAARTTGRLAEVMVEEGDPVEEGQIVARLIDEDQRAGVEQAQANLAQARARLDQARANNAETARRLDRRERLREQNLISTEEADAATSAAAVSRADMAAAEAGVGVAQAGLDAARLELDKTRVKAPFSGVVLRKDAEIGEIVGPIMVSNTSRAGAVVTIADMQTLEAGVDVNESYIARLRIGMPADVVLDAHPDVHFPAEVRAIYPSADRDKATIPVRVSFLVDDPRIRPDLGAKVTFLNNRSTTEIVTLRRVLHIPSSAVRGTAVWVVRGGKAQQTAVTLGEKKDGDIEILSGLNEGDAVIVSPGRLRNGMRVRVAETPAGGSSAPKESTGTAG